MCRATTCCVVSHFIGNSKGLRLPRHMLGQRNLTDGQTVAIGVQGSDIVIRPKASVRRGWDAAFTTAGAGRVRENLWDGVPRSMRKEKG